MNPNDLLELHYITPIENLSSILDTGLLSHNLAAKLKVADLSMPEVQARRSKKVPGGKPLHDYVNFYFHARNPMMYLRRSQHKTICVLCIERDVIRLPGVVVTDMNASSDYVRFAAGEAGLVIVDQERTYATYWTHQNPIEQYRRKSMKCAEVLIPERVDTTYVIGVYVSCPESEAVVQRIAPTLQYSVQVFGIV